MPRNVHIGWIKKKPKKTDTETPSEEGLSDNRRNNTVLVFKKKRYTKLLRKIISKLKNTRLSVIGSFFQRKFREFVVFCVGDRDLSFSETHARYVKPGYYLSRLFSHYFKLTVLFVRGAIRKLLPIVIPLCGVAVIAVSWWALSTHTVAV